MCFDVDDAYKVSMGHTMTPDDTARTGADPAVLYDDQTLRPVRFSEEAMLANPNLEVIEL